MAEVTLTIAVTQLRKDSAVMWISLGFTVLTIAYMVACFFAGYGTLSMAGYIEGKSKDGSGEGRYDNGGGAYAIFLGIFLVLMWGIIAISYIVHAVCAGVMGTWYFGTSRKRTVTDALVRALTTSLGSISFAAFIVAVIRTLEAMARDAKNKSAQNGNAIGMIFAC